MKDVSTWKGWNRAWLEYKNNRHQKRIDKALKELEQTRIDIQKDIDAGRYAQAADKIIKMNIKYNG